MPAPHRQRYFWRRCRTIRKLRSTTSISSASSYWSDQGSSVPPHCGHGAASSGCVCTTSTSGSAACARGPWPRGGADARRASAGSPPPRRSDEGPKSARGARGELLLQALDLQLELRVGGALRLRQRSGQLHEPPME